MQHSCAQVPLQVLLHMSQAFQSVPAFNLGSQLAAMCMLLALLHQLMS